MLLLGCGSFVSAAAPEAAGQTLGEKSAERHFEFLAVGALSFTNVWVHRQTNEVILIRHSVGIHSIKLSDLPSDELRELKSQIGDLAEVPTPKKTGWQNIPFVKKIMAMIAGTSVTTKAILGSGLFLMILLMVSKKLDSTSAEAA